MASCKLSSTHDEVDNYKSKLYALLCNSYKTIQILEEKKKTGIGHSDLDKEIEELHNNVLAIKTALKDIEELESKFKLVNISSQILEAHTELQEYKKDRDLLQKKKSELQSELSVALEKYMDKSILIAELKHEICPSEEEKGGEITDYNSVACQTEHKNVEGERSDATTQTDMENFEEESSDSKDLPHVSGPNSSN